MFAFAVKDNFKKLSKANVKSRKICRHKPFGGITCGSKTNKYYSRTSIKEHGRDIQTMFYHRSVLL